MRKKLIDKDTLARGIENLKSNLIYGACASQIAMETRCKEEAYNEVLSYLDTLEVKDVEEEPVSKELEKELDYGDYMAFFEEHPEYNDVDWGFEETWTFAQYCYKLGLKAQKGE